MLLFPNRPPPEFALLAPKPVPPDPNPGPVLAVLPNEKPVFGCSCCWFPKPPNPVLVLFEVPKMPPAGCVVEGLLLPKRPPVAGLFAWPNRLFPVLAFPKVLFVCPPPKGEVLAGWAPNGADVVFPVCAPKPENPKAPA